VARQAGGEAQGGAFSRTNPCEVTPPPPPSITDRFTGPSAEAVIARLFCSPSNTPTIRCSVKWQLGSLIHQLMSTTLSDTTAIEDSALEELIDVVERRLAEAAPSDLVSDLSIHELDDSLGFQFLHLVVMVVEVLLSLAILGASLFTDTTNTALIPWFGVIAVLLLLERRMAAISKSTKSELHQHLSVAIGCQWIHPRATAEPGRLSFFQRGWIGLVVSDDPVVLRDPESFEYGAALWALASQHEKLGDRLPNGVTPDLIAAMEHLLVDTPTGRNVEGPGHPAYKGAPTPQCLVPPAIFGGATVESVVVDFEKKHSPNKYVDRSFWPVVRFEHPDHPPRTALVPATYWWTPERDDWTEFCGPIGSAYQEIEVAWERWLTENAPS